MKSDCYPKQKKRMVVMKDLFRVGHRVGVFLALLFVLCFAWYWILPVHRELHMQLLELSFFGYKGMTGMSFIFGLIQSYVWGYIGVALWYAASLVTSD